EALALHMRKHLDGVQRMVGDLMKTNLDGPVQDAAHNTAAAVRAMIELVDQAVNGELPASPSTDLRKADGASFDIRRSAQGVRDLLSEEAKARGVTIEVAVAPGVPGLVHGDDVGIRAALMSLTSAALHLVQDGA